MPTREPRRTSARKAVREFARNLRLNFIDGLRRGSDARTGGIEIGGVTQKALGLNAYLAVAMLSAETPISHRVLISRATICLPARCTACGYIRID